MAESEITNERETAGDDRKDNTDDSDQFVRQLKELMQALRDNDECAAVNQPCLEDSTGGLECCRGLRCSQAVNRCELDCVADGQSCRHNWFCCAGRRCNDDFVCEKL